MVVKPANAICVGNPGAMSSASHDSRLTTPLLPTVFYHMYVFKQYLTETKPSRVCEGPYSYPSERSRHVHFNNMFLSFMGAYENSHMIQPRCFPLCNPELYWVLVALRVYSGNRRVHSNCRCKSQRERERQKWLYSQHPGR